MPITSEIMTVAQAREFIKEEKGQLARLFGSAVVADDAWQLIDAALSSETQDVQLRVEFEKGQLLVCAFNQTGQILSDQSQRVVATIQRHLDGCIDHEYWTHPNKGPGSVCLPNLGNDKSPNFGGFRGTGL